MHAVSFILLCNIYLNADRQGLQFTVKSNFTITGKQMIILPFAGK